MPFPSDARRLVQAHFLLFPKQGLFLKLILGVFSWICESLDSSKLPFE